MFDQWLDSLLETLNQEGFSLIDFELTVDEWREKFHNGENATLVANELLKSVGWIE